MGAGCRVRPVAWLERATHCQALAPRCTDPHRTCDFLRRAGHRRVEAAPWRAA